MQRTISFFIYNKESIKKRVMLVWCFSFLTVTFLRGISVKKEKHHTSITNGFLMSVLHSGVSHLFPFRTEK